MSFKVKRDSEHRIFIKTEKKDKVALILHGYGGSKEEMLPLGIDLAKREIGSTIIDLPGHGGRDELFTYEAFQRSIALELKCIPDECVVVGHSLGALMASKEDRRAVLISPPMELYFEGAKRELLKALRVRNVKEETYFSGLKSVLGKIDFQLKKDSSCIVYGENDLSTVIDYAKKARESGVETHMIQNSGHLDILDSAELAEVVGNWINGVLNE